jgi:hypothetical protein
VWLTSLDENCAEAGCSLGQFSVCILGKLGSLLCDGLCRCHDTCNTAA